MTEQERNAYVRRWMERVDEIAQEMDNGTIPMEDLISEGYVGLTDAMNDTPDGEEPDTGETEEAVRSAIRRALDEYRNLSEKDDLLIRQVELLNESIAKLTGELGAKPNVDEIANDMGISQEKVLDILKLTGEDTGE